ncbi:MAG: ADP-ribosylglycohydrolase family protein [Fibrobacterota bacterium]
MQKILLNADEVKDKIRACWYGKNIGGTLGAKWECKLHTHALTFYDPMPNGSAPNDDLDLQLVWLKMLEDKGVDPSLRTFAEYWERYAKAYPWNEYGFFMRNYTRGLLPPVAGCFENYYIDEEGSPIRSEIWACLHPADPQAAARMAWKDSAVDHAGGEGMVAEMFWAAVESAAFVIKDPLTLIRLGLNMLPISSLVARSIREALWCHENRLAWGEARDRIVSRFGGIQPCSAIPNTGFTIIGWLYGKDYGDRLCKAVNCGYDTDCTGATLGSLLGIMDGMAGIPKQWMEPVGNRIVLHPFTGACDTPATVEALTERTFALTQKVNAAKTEIAFGSKTELPDDLLTRLFRNQQAKEALAQDIHAAVELNGDKEIRLHYNGEPVLRPGIGREVRVTVDNAEPDNRATLRVPAEWNCTPLGKGRFLLFSGKPVQDRNIVTISIGGMETRFTILGPGEAKGFPAGDNVIKCPKCQARIEACICK